MQRPLRGTQPRPCGTDTRRFSAGTAAETVRQQVQQQRAASATCSVSNRMPAGASTQAVLVGETAALAGPSTYNAAALHAQEQLDSAYGNRDRSNFNSRATTRQMPVSSSFQRRLSPSVPTAPSRHNSTVEREPPAQAVLGQLNFAASRALHSALAPSVAMAPSRRNSMIERPVLKADAAHSDLDEDDLRVHFDKYADPSTYDVPPPATPHPSKGVLNPPQSPRSPAAAGASEAFRSHSQPGAHAVRSVLKCHLCKCVAAPCRSGGC